MMLNERIKQCRLRSGLTQEQVAEALNVSRQAVTKWENGQSAPSTENLFRLAQLFGTTVDLILTDESETKLTAAEEFYILYIADQQRQLEKRKSRRYNTLKMTLFTILWYTLILLCGFGLHDLGWMADEYLFFWLLSSRSLLIVFAVSIVLSVIGWNRVVFSLAAACLLGLVSGTIFGPNPEGAALGMGHYGWAYWIFMELAGLIVGMILECIYSRKLRKNIENST